MNFLIYLFIFILGACVGSFLNVLIIRLAAGEQVSRGRSKCVKCGRKLFWKDLIPIFSFFWLGRKCRYCRKKISLQYPIVEIVTGFLFLVIFIIQHGFSFFGFQYYNYAELAFFLFVASILIVIFVSDLKYFIIPDEMVIAGIIVVLLFSLFKILDFGGWDLSAISYMGLGIWQPLLFQFSSGAGASAFFMSVVVLTKGRGMGLGDVKFVFLMGLLLGWPGIAAGLLLAFSAGALFGIGLMLAGRATMKSELPFGTFLAASSFVMLVFQREIDPWLLFFFGA